MTRTFLFEYIGPMKTFWTALTEPHRFHMVELLRAGQTFSGAAAAHPEIFPAFYTGMLGAAELTRFDEHAAPGADLAVEMRPQRRSAFFP